MMQKHVALFHDLMEIVGLHWLTSLPTFNTVSLFMPVVKQWRVIHVEGQQSDQSDNLANLYSEVIINCIAIFYEEGKGGENYRKKKTSSIVW